MTRRRRTLPFGIDAHLAIGVLILLAAAAVLTVSYSAQNGLPWQAAYRVSVAVPEAGQLTKNADVRIGGARVGQVLAIDAVPRHGRVPAHALLDVRLERDAGPLPVDTAAEVRVASVLGGKYLALTPGTRARTIRDGGRLALANASRSVDVGEVAQLFDARGRTALRRSIGGFADAVAGRGGDINATLDALAPLLPGVQRFLATLGAPATNLRRLLAGAAATTGALQRTGALLPAAVGDASATLAALDAAGDALGRAVGALPVAEFAATAALGRLTPVLGDAAAIARDLAPAAGVLGPAARNVDAVMRTAIATDPKLATLARPLQRTLTAVGGFTANPSTAAALQLLGANDLGTFGASAILGLGALLRTTWDAEQHCGVLTTWIAHMQGLTGEGDSGGTWLRMNPMLQTSETLPADKPVAGLHANPYPNENAQECEAGNEPFLPGQQIGNPPGLQGKPQR